MIKDFDLTASTCMQAAQVSEEEVRARYETEVCARYEAARARYEETREEEARARYEAARARYEEAREEANARCIAAGGLTGHRNDGVNASFVAAFSAVVAGTLAMGESDFSIGGALGTAAGALAAHCLVDDSASLFTAVQAGSLLGSMGATAGSKAQKRFSPTSEVANEPVAKLNKTAAEEIFAFGVVEGL